MIKFLKKNKFFLLLTIIFCILSLIIVNMIPFCYKHNVIMFSNLIMLPFMIEKEQKNKILLLLITSEIYNIFFPANFLQQIIIFLVPLVVNQIYKNNKLKETKLYLFSLLTITFTISIFLLWFFSNFFGLGNFTLTIATFNNITINIFVWLILYYFGFFMLSRFQSKNMLK